MPLKLKKDYLSYDCKKWPDETEEEMNEQILRQIRLQRQRIHDALCDEMKTRYSKTTGYIVLKFAMYLNSFAFLALLTAKMLARPHIPYHSIFLPCEIALLCYTALILQQIVAETSNQVRSCWLLYSLGFGLLASLESTLVLYGFDLDGT